MVDVVHIYTDGSCNNATKGPGGWAFVALLPGGKQFGRFGNIPSPTTNNVAEIFGVMMAMAILGPTRRKLLIHSDSKYVVRGITEWVDRWHEEEYVGIKNAHLWRRMKQLKDAYHPEVKWVKGHAKIQGNEIADRFAGLGSRSRLEPMVTETLNFRAVEWERANE